MIERQRFSRIATVLTSMTITMENITSSQGNILVRNTHVLPQANYRRQWKISVDYPTVMLDLLSLIFKQENYRTTPARDV
ncbi:hypothetical protein C1752_06176 [Acaryochloris thomasi RCC1774]|uniref:Uncharacterized protein n=1 Tax=Acaryochloris thomasi RCC1774 TaxID=1764569 RepID=A0A2W1JCL3_9CYAN|nr:hypothetical protein C1752_06176 [Acaryochloris thomasi RCC1774]